MSVCWHDSAAAQLGKSNLTKKFYCLCFKATQCTFNLPSVLTTVVDGDDHGGNFLLRPGTALPASSTELLADMQSQLPHLSAQQLLSALRKLAALNCDITFDDPIFQSFCGTYAKRARGLHTHQLVEATRALARLRAPADSLPVAITLQLLRCQLDQLDVRQIMRLDNFVRLFNDIGGHSHLVDALQEALPLAFNMRLPLEFDPDDPHFLGKTLLYACGRAQHPVCIKQLVNALLEYENTLNAHVAADIIVALCDVNCTEKMYPERAQLLRICGDRLAQSLPNLMYGQVARVAGALGPRLRNSHVEYYHEELIDAIGLYATTCEKLWQALKLAQVTWAARYIHCTLATHLKELTEREGEAALNSLWPSNLLVLIECLADAHTVVHTDLLKQLATATLSGRPGDWIRLNVGLSALGHCDDTLLRRALSPQALEHAGVGERAYALAQWEQAALGGGGDRPREECTPLILTELARELGGEDLVARDVRLLNGVVAVSNIISNADGVVCVAEGQILVIESKKHEELNPPAGALLVCVLVLPDEWYSRNGRQARAGARLMEKLTRSAGHATLVVTPEKWASMGPRERGPLLARALRDLCADNGMPLLL
ncbi:hypothetical protein EVAR_83783_1 [Eumeta japonica]|uniref:RAP domain-containing protein n=1 Tax=Eumeta variegata TaxID=151549 RepID=A0A4C1WI96_EUMVA|nr:hypothetical protein EVAR_83783_1 [Eumeta japonica]